MFLQEHTLKITYVIELKVNILNCLWGNLANSEAVVEMLLYIDLRLKTNILFVML